MGYLGLAYSLKCPEMVMGKDEGYLTASSTRHHTILSTAHLIRMSYVATQKRPNGEQQKHQPRSLLLNNACKNYFT